MNDLENGNGSDGSAGDAGSASMYFFSGGGTGGHIYPAIAVAQHVRQIDPEACILFLCSERDIDSRVLSSTGFEYIQLPGRGFSPRPDRALACMMSLAKGYNIAKSRIRSAIAPRHGQAKGRAIMVGIGGFASAAGVLAAGRAGVPVAMVNVDIVPGRANRFFGRFAKRIFVQFSDTAAYFGKISDRVVVTGCPLRKEFENPDRDGVVEKLGLDGGKRTLVVTGASSGSASINRAIACVCKQLDEFADKWQMVHLTGSAANTRHQLSACQGCAIGYYPIDYFEDMAGLLGCADIVVGRSGAVSVAEYAASCTPAICMPYPWHKDRHQYLNAQQLADAGSAVIVEDIPDDADKTADELLRVLKELILDDDRRRKMAEAAERFADTAAARNIAEQLQLLLE